MAGTVRIVEVVENRHIGTENILKLKVEWTSDALGNADGGLGHTNGFVIGLQTKPGTGGDQPTDLYDITIEDELGYDVLEGFGADRSNAVVEKTPVLRECTIGTNKYAAHPSVCGSLTFKIAGAGNTKKGTAILYFK